MRRHTLVAFALAFPASFWAVPTAGATTFLTGDAISWSKLIGFSPSLIGRDLNGTGLNGTILDGRVVESVAYDGASQGGMPLDEAWVEAGQLVGRDHKGRLLKRERFVDVTMVATLDDGSSLALFVAGGEQHPERENHEVWGYDVWYPTAEEWLPLCGLDDDGLPVMAIPLAGRWRYESGVPDGGAHLDDPTSFTFGCESHVLAKCVTAGYHPWEEGLVCARGSGCTRRSLAPLHQACTRALRADYCGDGTSHTVDGTVINMYDSFGIRIDSDSWETEAVWDADGAVCLGSPRIEGETIACADALPAASCAAAEVDADPMRVETEAS